MVKIAVDAVLLPSDEMMDKAIEINQRLIEQNSDNIVLNKTNCLPHISLAMGAIDKSNIREIGDILLEIAQKYSFKRLIATDFSINMDSSNNTVSVLYIKKTNNLQLLHEEVMLKLKSFFSYNITERMLFSGRKISHSTMLWIKEYPQKSAYENFSPHITAGYGRAAGVIFPIEFYASKLALCHLGNHCTCRQILLSINLDFR